MRQVMLYKGEDGYWIAECPSLPGCVTQGKSKEEAIGNAKEAIRGLESESWSWYREEVSHA